MMQAVLSSRPIPRVTAMKHLDRAPQGTKKPHFFVCQEMGHRPADYLVKQLAPEWMAKEVMGNVLASAFGLNVPDPAVVLMSGPALKGVRSWCTQRGAYCPFRQGYAVGCVRTPFVMSFNPVRPLLNYLTPQVLRLFTFDALTLYADRTAENPNCALIRSANARQLDLLVFDFEQLYNVDLHADGADPRVFFGSVHCCRPLLRNQRMGHLAADIRGLQTVDFGPAIDSLPVGWQPEAKRIWRRVRQVDVADLVHWIEGLLQA